MIDPARMQVVAERLRLIAPLGDAPIAMEAARLIDAGQYIAALAKLLVWHETLRGPHPEHCFGCQIRPTN